MGRNCYRSGFLLLVCLLALAPRAAQAVDIPQWDVFELTLPGPNAGNPFIDVDLSARFTCDKQSLEVHGFYDGNGTYRIRFMPVKQGAWSYETSSNAPELRGKTGAFTCVQPLPGNHGIVKVKNTFHFAYADDTPFIPIGTTCYNWVPSNDAREEQTLETLKASPFNKVRMCVLPTNYNDSAPFNNYPFERTLTGDFDFSRFRVQFFQHMEQRIKDLRDIGVQADLILYTPYNGENTGFDRMEPIVDDRYLRYVVARFGAYSNVWWSIANEFDLVETKTDADWDRYFKIVQADDPYYHLRSIHHSKRMYDSSKPWVTHVSVQNGIAPAEFGRVVIYRQALNKPIVLDELQYEGSIASRWGQLSGEEMTLRFWMCTIAGAYATHGEVLSAPRQGAFISGGTLKGESPARIAFLKSILDTAPSEGVDPIDQYYRTEYGGQPGKYYLVYFGRERPTQWNFELPQAELEDGMKFKVDVIDTWNMTIEPVEGPFTVYRFSQYLFGPDPERYVKLPGKPYMALRITRIEDKPTTTTAPALAP